MVTRRISTILEGTSTSLVRAYEEAGRAAERNADRIAAFGKRVGDNEEHYRRAGTAIVAFGAATTTALTLSAAAAVSWESDFAGVMKTVDDSAEGYANLSDELRQMARTLPSTHTEIAATAEAAGQLGVAREDITSFTRTMIDLGETTNLSAEEAATSIAQMTNVMRTAPEDVERLGSTLVDLGNNSATTERNILLMSQRLAGAGAVAGLTEADVLALSAATASMGIEVEAGGTAVSKVLIDMSKAASQGGDDLEAFAQVAGVSAAEFARAFREDPAQAFALFIDGLGQMQAAGDDVFTTLDSLGLSEVRVSRALLGMASAGDLLTDSLDLSKQAWEENTALAEEAAQRYGTTASKLEVLKNNVRDAGISLGEVFLPAIAALASTGADVAGWLSDLPKPLQQIAAWGGAAAGSTALLAGSMMLLAPHALETYRALRQIGIIGPRAAAGIKAVTGILTGPWGIAIGAAVAAIGFFAVGQIEANARAKELRDTLDQQTGAITDNTRAWLANDLQDRGILDSYEQMGGQVRDLTAAIEGDADARQRIIDTVTDYASANEKASASTGGLGVNLSDASTKAARFIEQLDRYGVTIDQQGEKARQLAEANDDATRSTQALDAETRRLTGQAEAYLAAQDRVNASLDTYTSQTELALAAGEEASEAMTKWKDATADAYGSFVNVGDALAANEEAARQWAETTAVEAGRGKEAWADYVEDATFNLDTFLAELEKQITAQEDWATNILILSSRMSDAAIDMLIEMGPAGAQAVAALVDGGQEELDRFEEIAYETGGGVAASVATGMYDGREVMRAAAAVLGQDVADEIAAQIASGETTVEEVVEKYDLEAWVTLQTDETTYRNDLGLLVGFTEEQEPVITIDADNAPALGVLLGTTEEINLSEGTVTIYANDDEADGELGELMYRIDTAWGTVNIAADAWNAYAVLEGFLARIPRSVTIGLNALPVVGSIFGALPGFAGGGALHGPGTGTSDSFVIRASNGEHMWTKAEVDAAGGHDEVYRIRRAVLEGDLRFDIGGQVGAPRADRALSAPPRITTAPPVYGPPSATASAPVHNVEVTVPVQTFERADPVLIGAKAAWQVQGALP